MVLQLIAERQAGIPLLMEALDGNNSDKRSFRETVNAYMQQLNQEYGLEYLIADSALYTAETLGEMNGFYWITRVPETLDLARVLIQAMAPDLMTNREQASFISVGTRYADVAQRWAIVYSPEAYRRAIKTVNKASLNQTSAELTAFEPVCRQTFACEKDAHNALSELEKKLRHTQVFDARIIAQARYSGGALRPNSGYRITRPTGSTGNSPRAWNRITSVSNGKAALSWPPISRIWRRYRMPT